jgi:hypothetical protein
LHINDEHLRSLRFIEKLDGLRHQLKGKGNSEEYLAKLKMIALSEECRVGSRIIPEVMHELQSN